MSASIMGSSSTLQQGKVGENALQPLKISKRHTILTRLSLSSIYRQLFLAFVLFFSLISVLTAIDCCSADYSSMGVSCENDVVYNNVSYYCTRTYGDCDSCYISANISTSLCTRCCVTSTDSCDDDALFGTDTYFSAWSKSFFSLNFPLTH